MITRRLILAAPAVLVACARPAAAQSITWNGVPTQGGLLRGQAPPGTRMALDGRAVRVAPGGAFAMGFSRDHDESATLVITHPDGRREERRGEERRRGLQCTLTSYRYTRVHTISSGEHAIPPITVKGFLAPELLIGVLGLADQGAEAHAARHSLREDFGLQRGRRGF